MLQCWTGTLGKNKRGLLITAQPNLRVLHAAHHPQPTLMDPVLDSLLTCPRHYLLQPTALLCAHLGVSCSVAALQVGAVSCGPLWRHWAVGTSLPRRSTLLQVRLTAIPSTTTGSQPGSGHPGLHLGNFAQTEPARQACQSGTMSTPTVHRSVADCSYSSECYLLQASGPPHLPPLVLQSVQQTRRRIRRRCHPS